MPNTSIILPSIIYCNDFENYDFHNGSDQGKIFFTDLIIH
jgi:hypothetical protein